jgi:hypothetical protein
MLIHTYQTAWCHIPEEPKLNSHNCKDLKLHDIINFYIANMVHLYSPKKQTWHLWHNTFAVPAVHVGSETLPCHDILDCSSPDDCQYTLPAKAIPNAPEPDATVLSHIRDAD